MDVSIGAFYIVVFYLCPADGKIVSRRFSQMEDADSRGFFYLYLNLRPNLFNLREMVFAGCRACPNEMNSNKLK
jgi:hypothetical protein